MMDLMNELPRSLEDITAEWVSAALKPAFPGIAVTAVRSQSLHEGTASTSRLYLEYAQPAGDWPATICMKSDIGLPHAERLMQAGIYRKEAIVYRDVLPATAALTPVCYAAHFDESGRAYMLLQDLAAIGGRFCAPVDMLSVEQVKTGIEQLAKLHARTWESDDVADAQWLHHGVPLSEEDPFWNTLFDRYDDYLAEPHTRATARIFHQVDTVRSAFNRLRTCSSDIARSLIHGDAHVGNFFTDRSGAMGMADFQCVQRGHFSHDLAMLIGSSLDPADRRAHERELIDHYLEIMRSLVTSPPAFDEAWLGYRQHMIYALVVWLFTTRDYQPEHHLITNVFRFGVAAIDLDSLAAIESVCPRS